MWIHYEQHQRHLLMTSEADFPKQSSVSGGNLILADPPLCCCCCLCTATQADLVPSKQHNITTLLCGVCGVVVQSSSQVCTVCTTISFLHEYLQLLLVVLLICHFPIASRGAPTKLTSSKQQNIPRRLLYYVVLYCTSKCFVPIKQVIMASLISTAWTKQQTRTFWRNNNI